MQTYLFDFDGTLVDSMPIYANVMLQFLDNHNIKRSKDILNKIVPLGYKGTAEYYRELGIDLSVEEIIRKLKADVQREYQNNIPAKKNVVTVLNELKKQGNKLNILTASPHEMLDCCLKRLGVFDLFDNVWSCDDFNRKKTDVELYREVAKILGISEKNINFFDDNLFGLMTAKEAGLKVFGVYDKFSRKYKKEIKKLTEKYIVDFRSLL